MNDVVSSGPTIQSYSFNANLLSSILWQYGQSTNLQALLTAKQNWYNTNETQFWENWITNVFDLTTANQFGCVVWAIILGIPTSYITPGVTNTKPFGVGPDTITTPAGLNGFQNFNYSNFASANAGEIVLTLPDIRIILQMRYRQLISRGTVSEVNKILKDILVPLYGPIYMQDNLNMTQTVVCVNGINSFLGFIFTELDILPRPAGVQLLVAT